MAVNFKLLSLNGKGFRYRNIEISCIKKTRGYSILWSHINNSIPRKVPPSSVVKAMQKQKM